MSEQISVSWRREVYSDAGFQKLQTSEVFRVPDGTWSVRDGNPYVTFTLPAEEPSQAGDRLTLRFSAAGVRLVRHGQMTWQHTFETAKVTESQLRVGQFTLPFTSRTILCELIQPEEAIGGKLLLVYEANMGGDVQYVKLEMACQVV